MQSIVHVIVGGAIVALGVWRLLRRESPLTSTLLIMIAGALLVYGGFFHASGLWFYAPIPVMAVAIFILGRRKTG